jgi:hypothetical protein
VYEALVVTLIEAGIAAATAAAIAALLTVLIIVGVSASISYISKEAGEWAAERWGPAWGALVQIIVTVAMSYGVSSMGGGAGFTAPTLAQSVLQIGQQLLSAMAAYTQYTHVALQDEINAWNKQLEGNGDLLARVNELLEDFMPNLSEIQQSVLMPKPEYLDEFLGRTLTSVDGLTNKLILPVSHMAELTLTPRL